MLCVTLNRIIIIITTSTSTSPNPTTTTTTPTQTPRSSSLPSILAPNPQQQQQIIHNSYKYMCTLEVKIIANLTSSER